MTDIVKQLRGPVLPDDLFVGQWPGEEVKTYDAVRFHAADEIEQNRIDLEEYRRDVERLRAALREISGDNWFFIEDAKNYALAALGGEND
jgi:hypothetical protein